MLLNPRSWILLVLALGLLMGMVPAGAFGGVTGVTWERNWGTPGTSDGQFNIPADVAVDKWGNVYVAGGQSGDHRIQMFSPAGTFIRSVGTVTTPSALLDSPISVTTDRWGNIYVGEKGNGARIQRFFRELYGPTGSYIDGSDDSAIDIPQRLGVSLDQVIYVSEASVGHLQKWSPYGEFGGYWNPAGIPTMGLGVSQDGLVYTTTDIASGLLNSVVVYRDSLMIDSWGGYGTAAGQFRRPYDIEADGQGNVFVIESEGSRGQVFTAGGDYQTQFGSAGAGDQQFSGPYGIGVGPDRTVYVADTFHNRISKWRTSVPAEVAKVEGANRIATAVSASRKAYPGKAPAVIITTGYNWPDALGGAALAGAVEGPILLTAKDQLPAEVRAEIVRLGPEKIYVLGSEAAVSKAVEAALKAIFPADDFQRLGGADRYETAILIADKVKALRGWKYDGAAFVCTGTDFPDALAAAPIAAANGWPIYLTRPDSLSASVKAAMLSNPYGGNPSHHGHIIGSEAAIGKAVYTTLNSLPFQGFDRIGGANRYETAAKLADIAYNDLGMLWSRPALATGENFPDALAGGALQGDDCSVLLLTRKGSLPSEASALLAKNKQMIYEMRFFGDTNAISTTVRNQVRGALGLPY